MSKKKILIIRPDMIGDCILITPAISRLREKYPYAHIAVLANSYTEAIFKHNPDINEIIIDPFYEKKRFSFKEFKSFVKDIKSKRFDVSIHFYNEFIYAYLAKAAKIKTRIGDKSKPLIAWLYNKKVAQNWNDLTLHEVENNLKLLKPLRIDISNPPPLNLKLSEDDKAYAEQFKKEHNIKPRETVIGIHLGTGKGNKPYLPERYAKVIDFLIQKHSARVILTGSEKEKNAAEKVLRCCKHKPINLVNKTNLDQLISTISTYTIFIGVDTGPLHIAAALGKKIVGILGTKFVKPSRWGPWQTPHKIVRKAIKCHKKCLPSACLFDDCLKQIQPEDITEAVQELLQNGLDIKEDWLRLSYNILTDDDSIYRELNSKRYHAVKFRGYSLFEILNLIKKEDINIIHWVGKSGRFKIALARFLSIFSAPLPPLLVFTQKKNNHTYNELTEIYTKGLRQREYL